MNEIIRSVLEDPWNAWMLGSLAVGFTAAVGFIARNYISDFRKRGVYKEPTNTEPYNLKDSTSYGPMP